MNLAFDEVKATQAAALFVRLAGRPLNYMALIKLLYKADREALRRWGLPITTDKYASMNFGPVTSRIYDLIKASANPNSHPSFWATHLQKGSDRYEVVLARDPGDSELSPAEESLIREVFSVDGGKDRFVLADESHREFPEWKDPQGTSLPLDISDIIQAIGLSEEDARHVEANIEAQRAAFALAG